MKLLVYIFAFYLVLLPLVGIAGGSQCGDISYIENAGTDAHENENKNADENCTPFCNCACCLHIISNNFQLQKLSVLRITHTDKTYAPYKNILLPTDFWGNIWQPPKTNA